MVIGLLYVALLGSIGALMLKDATVALDKCDGNARAAVLLLTVGLPPIEAAALAAGHRTLRSALAAARFRFRGRAALIVMLIVVQMVPLEALIIPIYLMLDGAGQTDRLAGIIVTYLTFVLPFSIWTLRGFIVNIPEELEEAAMVDGCTRAGAFRRILFPLVAPGLVATAVFSFILVWNDYLIAYVLLRSPEKQTLGIWLASFTTNHGTEWGGVMAGSTLFAIPAVVFFLLVQRRVVSGLTAGAVKG